MAWRFRGRSASVDPGQAAQMLAAPGTALIDVRSQREYRAGHIKGSIHIPLGELQPAELDRTLRYVVVCHSGARSALATRRLRSDDLDAVNLRGGMTAWRRAGLPTKSLTVRRRGARGDVSPTDVLTLMAGPL